MTIQDKALEKVLKYFESMPKPEGGEAIETTLVGNGTYWLTSMMKFSSDHPGRTMGEIWREHIGTPRDVK